MNVKKFFANTSREALRRVRGDLGPDAVILSNRGVDGGVEILALASDDISSLVAHAPTPRPTPARRNEPTLDALGPLPVTEAREASRRAEPAAPAQAAAPAPRRAPDPAAGLAQAVMGEIRSMRGMLEEQLASLSMTDTNRRAPARARVMRELLAAGFSGQLTRALVDKVPAGADPEQGMTWARSALERNLTTLNDETAMMEKGGVYALVGPTGVGKTTTTAKLAARCVVRHGADRLALLTTDGYRIGAHEQLRIYGRILGVTVHAVKDASDLKLALSELRNKHMVLIDTVGMGQRDRTVAEQVAMLRGVDQVKRLLLLSANSAGDTLDEVVRAYQGDGLAGCILTKLDEAVSMGHAIDTVIRHRLCVYYMANGQRVPEDLHVASARYLMHRAFKPPRAQSPFALNDDELPALFGTYSGSTALAGAGAVHG